MFRALLILLALLWTAPAAAMPACHDASPTVAHTMPMAHHRTPEAQPPHACLGCVPVSDRLAAPIAPPKLAPPAAPISRIVRLDLGRAPPPLLRPPRLG